MDEDEAERVYLAESKRRRMWFTGCCRALRR